MISEPVKVANVLPFVSLPTTVTSSPVKVLGSTGRSKVTVNSRAWGVPDASVVVTTPEVPVDDPGASSVRRVGDADVEEGLAVGPSILVARPGDVDVAVEGGDPLAGAVAEGGVGVRVAAGLIIRDRADDAVLPGGDVEDRLRSVDEGLGRTWRRRRYWPPGSGRPDRGRRRAGCRRS